MKLLKYFLLLICLFSAFGASAQHPDDEYYPYAGVQEERAAVLLTDSTLFFRAVQAPSDIYDKHTAFNLPAVAVKRRGQERSLSVTAAGGFVLPYYAASAMRLMGATETVRAGIAPAQSVAGGTAGIREFGFPDTISEGAYRLSVGATDRNYLVAAKLSIVQPLGAGWSASLAADVRTGRDMYVEGVFTNSVTAGFRLAKAFGADHTLDFTVIAAPSMRGTRLSSVEEAFTLTGDRLYNPAWGFQNGKVRNSRVRRDFVPMAIASYKAPLTPTTILSLTLGAEAGEQKYSALEWYDASTPMPDNYRYLPGYTGDSEALKAWHANDTRYTQICWDELVAQNRMAGGEAVYALADRVERLLNVQADALFTTRADERLTVVYGAMFRRSESRNYRQMRDLLGAKYVVDTDQYLVDDDTYGNMLQNDLRHPDRKIAVGDRFGYDYALTVQDAGVHLGLEYRADRFRADLSASLREATVSRYGYCEKELFPGEESYGRSRKLKFRPYAAKALAGWAFSPRSYIEMAAAAGLELPEADALFYQPQYNNRTVDDPAARRYYAAEINYRRSGAAASYQFTAYATASFDGIDTRRYFDDVAGLFCNITASGIGRMAYGAEAAADFRLSYRWRLALAAAVGRFEYVRDPLVTIISDAGNAAVDTQSASHMGGCYVGNAPQRAACAELVHFGRGNWGFRLSAGYAGERYVEPMLVRRTERIARQSGTTQEALSDFVRQERLDDAFAADAAVWKTFWLGKSKLTFMVAVNNLTGEEGMAYGGYESLRVRRIRSGDATYYQPHATRYTYAGARSFYASASLRF